jgi:hypothetical protein
MFLLLDNDSVFVLAYSEELNCAVPSSLPLSSVNLGCTDPTQKEGPVISHHDPHFLNLYIYFLRSLV